MRLVLASFIYLEWVRARQLKKRSLKEKERRLVAGAADLWSGRSRAPIGGAEGVEAAGGCLGDTLRAKTPEQAPRPVASQGVPCRDMIIGSLKKAQLQNVSAMAMGQKILADTRVGMTRVRSQRDALWTIPAPFGGSDGSRDKLSTRLLERENGIERRGDRYLHHLGESDLFEQCFVFRECPLLAFGQVNMFKFCI